MVYQVPASAYPAQLSGAWDDFLAEIKEGNMPDTIAGIKTTELIGYAAVASAGLLTFLIVRKIRKRERKKR